MEMIRIYSYNYTLVLGVRYFQVAQKEIALRYVTQSNQSISSVPEDSWTTSTGAQFNEVKKSNQGGFYSTSLDTMSAKFWEQTDCGEIFDNQFVGILKFFTSKKRVARKLSRSIQLFFFHKEAADNNESPGVVVILIP